MVAAAAAASASTRWLVIEALVHGLSTDDTAEAADDAHEDDLWIILNQALEPRRYPAVRAMCLRYCDLWAEFWTEQMHRARA